MRSFAEAWLAWMLERSLAGLLVGVVVLGLLVLLPRRRVSAHALSHLLLLPLLVLAVPVERLLPVGWAWPVPNLVQVVGGTGIAAGAGTVTVVNAGLAPGRAGYGPDAATGFVAGPPSTDVAAATWPALALCLWLAVVGAGAAQLLRWHHRAVRGLVGRSRRPDPGLYRRLDRLRREVGIRAAVRLRIVDGLASPLVSGLMQPTVYVPEGITADLAAPQLDFVLLHELEHVRRRDVLVAGLTAGVRLAFWFHPMAWLATALAARWREYACDEAALAHASGPRRGGHRLAAAKTLYALIARTSAPLLPTPVHAPFLSPVDHMKHRILRLLDARRDPRSRMTPASLAALALGAALSLTAVRSQDPPQRASGTDSPVAPGAVAPAFTEGAAWLLRNQAEDGRWAIGSDPAGRDQRDHNEVCVTAMAIRALLPGLRSESLPIARAVRDAAAFLQGSQQESGRFGPEDPHTMMYAHANALRALCAVQREWPEDDRRNRIERGVAWALAARNPYMGWRYTPRCGDNDSKITAMMLLALVDATALGIEVDAGVFAEAGKLLEVLTDGATGRTGFVTQGQVMSRFTSKKADFPGELSEEPTAMRLLVLAARGEPLDTAACMRSVGLVAALPPEWDRQRGSIDYAYWEFGAELMQVVGGEQADRWRAKLHAALLPNRITEGGAAHWPAVDAWSHPGMEAYATASAMLALRALR